MYVCVCNAVTERQIHEAVNEGATTVRQLKEQLGVGADCASCASCAKACINDAKKAQKTKKLQAVLIQHTLIQSSPGRLGAA